MSDLGSIYGKKIDGSNTLVIDFSNVQISGTIKLPDSSNNGYGSSGQVLTSFNETATVMWTNQIDTTYSDGVGVTINGSNQINIGQSVATSDSPSFNQLTLGSVGNNSGIINLKDTTNLGLDTIAQMKGILDGNNGGQLEFHTKELDGGSLTKRMAIKQDGTMELYTDNSTGLAILTEDKLSQQSYIYNSTNGTRDLTIDCYSAVTNKGISFQTGGTRRMRITNTGEFLFGASNSAGSTNDVLTSGGGVGPPYWAPIPASGNTYFAGSGLTLTATTFSNPYNSFYPGNKLYNSTAAGQYGVARVDFTDGNSMAFHGSNYGGSYLDFLFMHPGLQIGSVTGTNWRGTQILALNPSSGDWEIYDFAGGATNLVPYSDDRIKTHEQTFSGETYINYIKQIVPKKYKKYSIILTEEEEKLLEAGGDPFKDKRTGDPVKDTTFTPQIEYGVIAQDIHKISGLEDIVKVGNDKTKWRVDYRSIDTITLGAVKGLIDKIEKLEARIKTLEGK